MAIDVMLSSTLRGDAAKELRNAALAGIRRARLPASACEDWTATPNSPLEESITAAQNAGLYLLVLGSRYGTSCSDADPRSYTEVEFDEATAAAVPRLAFIQENYPIEPQDDPEEMANQVRK